MAINLVKYLIQYTQPSWENYTNLNREIFCAVDFTVDVRSGLPCNIKNIYNC